MIFQYIEKLIDSILINFDSHLLGQQMLELKIVITIWITIWMMLKGYQIIAGYKGINVADVIYKMFALTLIIALAFDTSWITKINSAIEGIHIWAGGGDVSLYVKLDSILQIILEIGKIMEATDGSFDMVGLFSQALTWFGFLLVAIPTVGILIYTQLALKLLLVITPLMILSLAFGWLKPIFSRWLEMIIANVFTLIFVGLFFKMFSESYQKYTSYALSQAGNSGFDVFGLASDVFLVSLVMSAFVFSSMIFASKLSSVALDDSVKDSVRSFWKKANN